MKINYKVKQPEIDLSRWVVVLEEDINYYNCEKNKAQCINSESNIGKTHWFNLKFSDGNTNGYNKVRPATLKEVMDILPTYKKNKISYT